MNYRTLGIIALFFCSSVRADSPAIHWIWNSASRSKNTSADFTKSFPVDGAVKMARIKLTADFASAHVLIDKQTILELEAYDPPRTLDIRKYLKQGENTVTIEAHGVPGPSAIAALISIRFQNENSPPLEIASDASWQAKSFGLITPERWADNRLPEINAFAEYNQWREALPGDEADSHALQGIGKLPAGFEIEIIHQARKEEGSWVSMAIDRKNRVILAREDKGLLRLKLPKGDSKELHLESINDTLEECRGLAWKDDTLFANANDSKGLYRLRDTSGDDVFDEITLLQATEGGVGHGRNDLTVGPDGWIHAIQGDSVKVPEKALRLTVSEPDGSTELGHWLRTNRDGKIWEIRARGLRNPYGIAFNTDGEAFTYDADNEGDVGLPFYRPTRINHLVAGANYGWHQQEGNTRNMTVYSPDSVPTTYDVGRGSPTAVKFGTKSNFPPRWREALFALDWAYGRIIAIHLTPRGASYYGSGEVFLEGRPLNVTDLDFDSEGNMLFITGGRKTQSTLYRIRYTDEVSGKSNPTTQQKERSKYSSAARKLRHGLENKLNKNLPVTADLPLGDPDPWIRNAARVVLEKASSIDMKKYSDHSSGNLAELTALLALARTGSDGDKKTALNRALEFPHSNWGRNEKLTLLRICELVPSSEVIGILEPMLPDISDPVNRELSRVLCPLGSKKAVSASLAFMQNSSDQLEQLHYLEALSHTPKSGWTPQNRELFFKYLGTSKHFSRGDRFMAAFFESLEKRALAEIKDDANRERLTAILIAAAKPDPGKEEKIEQRQFVKNWTMSDFDFKNIPNKKFDLENGKRMFTAALCSRCHVCGNEGRSVGPDLTQVGRRFNRHDLLLSIIKPSQVVAEVHRNVIIKRKDSSTISGRVALDDFRKSIIYLSTNPFLPDELTEIPKSSIDSLKESPVSPMPPALLNTLSKKDIADLLEWISLGGG